MNKIRKLEKNRYSILTDDLTKCFICGMPKNHLHEVFYGKNRVNSMKYGCVVPLCFKCHENVHHNPTLDNKLKKICQKEFQKVYTESFVSIFYKNYI